MLYRLQNDYKTNISSRIKIENVLWRQVFSIFSSMNDDELMMSVKIVDREVLVGMLSIFTFSYNFQ